MPVAKHVPKEGEYTPDTRRASRENDARTASFRYTHTLLFLTALLALLTSSLYKLVDAKLSLTYEGYHSLAFADTDSPCEILLSESGGFSALRRVVTWSPDDPHLVRTCSSQWFAAKSNFIEFEYAGYYSGASPHEMYIEVERQGKESQRFVPPRGKRVGTWRLAGVLLPDFSPGELIRVRLVDGDSGSGWLSLRTRTNFYTTSELLAKIRSAAGTFKLVLKILSVCFLVAFILQVTQFFTSTAVVWGAAALVVLVVQFRSSVYFYHDDLQFIERFATQGIASLLANHHEHVLPIFNALFYFEYSLFAGSIVPYLVVTIVLQTMVATLLYLFLNALGVRPQTSGIVAVVFLSANWLLSEAMQWATCQSLLLSSIFRITAYYCAVRLLKSDRTLPLASSLFLSIVSAQLSFAGGMTVSIEVLLLVLCFFGWSNAVRPRIVLPVALAFAVGICIYLATLLQAELRHERISFSNTSDLLALARFAFLGAEYGTLLRSFGLDSLGVPINGLFPRDVWWTLYGLVVAVCIFCFYQLRGNANWKFWCFGQCVLLIAMTAAGVGRVHWGGIEYVLKLRYHALGLVAASILLVPLIDELRRYRSLFVLALSVWLFQQITLSTEYRKYVVEGPQLRRFAAQLVEWCHVTNATSSSPLAYIGFPGERVGDYPLPYGKMRHEPYALSPWSNNLYFLAKYLGRGDK